MIKSIKVRLHPNNKQLAKLFQYAGCARFAYNWAINREQENYNDGNKFLSDNDLRKEFTQLKKREDYKWLNHVSSNIPNKRLRMLVMRINYFSKDNVDIRNLRARKILSNHSIKII